MFDFDLNADINSLSPLVFAYVGDAVYELFIRTMISKDKNIPVNKLHRLATTFVCAKAQAETIKKIENILNEDELCVFKRGRNAKSQTSAKNADILDYRHATGFETLLGYLYFKKEFNRLEEILKLSYDLHK